MLSSVNITSEIGKFLCCKAIILYDMALRLGPPLFDFAPSRPHSEPRWLIGQLSPSTHLNTLASRMLTPGSQMKRVPQQLSAKYPKLITYISGSNPLPTHWMPLKKRNRSAEDLFDLRKALEATMTAKSFSPGANGELLSGRYTRKSCRGHISAAQLSAAQILVAHPNHVRIQISRRGYSFCCKRVGHIESNLHNGRFLCCCRNTSTLGLIVPDALECVSTTHTSEPTSAFLHFCIRVYAVCLMVYRDWERKPADNHLQ